jgi:cytochrome c6
LQNWQLYFGNCAKNGRHDNSEKNMKKKIQNRILALPKEILSLFWIFLSVFPIFAVPMEVHLKGNIANKLWIFQQIPILQLPIVSATEIDSLQEVQENSNSISQLPIEKSTFASGKKIFQANCSVCHIGGTNIIIPEKNLKKNALEANGMNNLNSISYQIINGKNGMPAFGGRLEEDEIEILASYVLKQSLTNFAEN